MSALLSPLISTPQRKVTHIVTNPLDLQMITAAVTAAILYSVKAKRDSDQAYSRRALARDTKDKSSGNAGP